MQGKQKYFLILFVLFSFAACDQATVHDGSPMTAELPIAGGSIIYLPNASQTPPQIPGQTITDGGAPTAATRQSIVSGTVTVEGYQSGAIDVSALEAAACDKGFCPIEGKPPLAATRVSGQGYYSLVVPNYGQALVLKGSHVAPDQKTYGSQLYLGALGQRKDDAVLILKAE